MRAFAKINLSLRVLGTRPDGYHELRTLFQSIALHDTLTVRRVPGPFRLTSDDPACPPDRSNLVWRAAVRVWRAAGKRGAPRGVGIHLAKRIPMQAGLGGGSSDAAAAIRALGRLWHVDDRRQRAIGAALGADVPYFFEGGTVLGLERGDLLFPLADQQPAWVVLVLPSFGLSTKDAFEWFDRASRASRGSRGPKRAALQDRLMASQSRAVSRNGVARPFKGRDPFDRVNDLERPVATHHPEISRLVRALRRAGAAQAAMTGSGSAVFGLFSSRNDAMDAAVALFARGQRVLVTHTIDRESYQRLAAK